MLKKLLAVFVVINISACSMHLRESGFIAQDKVVTDYTVKNIASWQQQFPEVNLQQISVESADNSALLKGLFVDNPQSDELIFIIQGNGMKVKDGGIAMLKTLFALGKDLVIFDRRGLGASTGKATIANLITDAKTQYQYLKKSLKPSKIIIHGYSLGSFIAAQLAKSADIDALVLQGTATNVDEWIDARMSWYTKLFVNVEVDEAFSVVDNKNIVMQNYHGPLLIIAGEKDQQAPAILAKQLFLASSSTNKQLIMVKNATHGTMLDKFEQIARYKEFLQTL